MAEHHHQHHHGHHHHGHAHHAHHGHHHAPTNAGWRFAVAAALNLGFVLAEAGAGIVAHSSALLADAGHNLSDCLSLLLAWGAARLAARAPSQRFTYGLKQASILAALANGALLFAALGGILIEALRHLAQPQPVAAPLVMAMAAAGIAVNGLSALLFATGAHADLNLRAAFQHLLADAAVSAGVVVAGALVYATGALWIDPLTSLVIIALLGWGGWGLLRDAAAMALQAVPPAIDHAAVQAHLLAQSGVGAVHHLHIWPISTTETALTAHLVMPAGHPGDAVLQAISQSLASQFGIGHATLQVEHSASAACAKTCGL